MRLKKSTFVQPRAAGGRQGFVFEASRRNEGEWLAAFQRQCPACFDRRYLISWAWCEIPFHTILGKKSVDVASLTKPPMKPAFFGMVIMDKRHRTVSYVLRIELTLVQTFLSRQHSDSQQPGIRESEYCGIEMRQRQHISASMSSFVLMICIRGQVLPCAFCTMTRPR